MLPLVLTEISDNKFNAMHVNYDIWNRKNASPMNDQ